MHQNNTDSVPPALPVGWSVACAETDDPGHTAVVNTSATRSSEPSSWKVWGCFDTVTDGEMIERAG